MEQLKSTLEIPDNQPDLERLLIAARALWRACAQSDTWDKVQAHRQAKADLDHLLDHYGTNGVHRDVYDQPTEELECVKV